MHRFTSPLVALTGLLYSSAALAGWTVDDQQSRLSFVSIKAGTIAEVHHFEQLNGTLTDDGRFSLTIDLNSVETLIPIRNERMRDQLFDTARFPNAVLNSRLDLAAVHALDIGEQTRLDAEAQLELVGQSSTLTVQAVVARLSDQQLLVTSAQPLTLNAISLGLGDGVEQLREVAGLPSISPAVPVTFQLTLSAD
ncbi:MAG: YceI family protein [Pseudomonadota bacterium]